MYLINNPKNIMHNSVYFRVDSSIQIGTGHIMRCLTLADELRLRSVSVSFVCCEEPGNLINHIEKNGYKVYCLPAGIDREEDRKRSEEILVKHEVKPDGLIIDHYDIDTAYELPLRKFAKKIMVIDDLANRRHDCDILLDQNYSGNRKRYNGLVPEHCIQLLGPEYALLRPQFREARENLRERDGGVKKILVFMGGADPTNETGKVLQALKMLNGDDIATDVVIGTSNPNRDEVEKLVSQISGTTFYCNVDNMAELMSSADISIGASGTSTWERCCIGLPSMVMILADNQKEIAVELDKEGVVVNLGWHEDVTEMDIRDAVQSLLADSDKRRSMGVKGKMMVDGNGATRVVEKMIFSLEAVSV